MAILPCFNEEVALAGLLQEILATGLSPGQIIVVSDGSTDGTAGVANRAGVHLVDLPINLGIGGALQAGYLKALQEGAAYGVQVDGDGQHDPHELATLAQAALADGADLVIGSRFLVPESDGFKSSTMRRLGIRWLSAVIRFATGRRITDPTSGFRLASKRLMERFAAEYPSDYPEPETAAEALSGGFKVREVSVRMRVRQGGHSSIIRLDPIYYMIKVTMGILVGSLRGRFEKVCT